MKTILKRLFVVMMATMLVGCGGGDSSDSSKQNESSIGNTHKNIEYYEELATLPTMDSTVEVEYKGMNSTSIDGVTTSIVYRYRGSEQNLKDYAEYLKNNSFKVHDSESGFIIEENGYKVAKIEIEGSEIRMNIIPENERDVMVLPKDIKIGDTIELDFVTMSLDNILIDDEVYPLDTSGLHMYISDVEGSKYAIIQGYIKNLSDENIASDYVSVTFTINDKYNYNGEMSITANPSKTTNYAITPFEESYYLIYASIPDDALSTFKNGKVSIKFNKDFASGKEYTYVYNIPWNK